MSDVYAAGLASGLSDVFACIYDLNDKVRDFTAGAWDTFTTADLDDYDIALTEIGDSGVYAGDIPAGLPAGRYFVKPYRGDPSSQSITHYRLEAAPLVWNGTSEEYVIDTNGQVDVSAIYGPGDYDVTLTIRTTGGTPVPGVGVWLNTASVRSGAVTGILYTDANGTVTFTLEYSVTYYIFCLLAGYTFTNANMTPEAGSVTFTKDIATATVVGGDSGYDESFLTRAVALTRTSINEPSINVKYTDDEIITKLEQVYPLILGEINRNSQTPVVAFMDITISSGVTKYQLPHLTGSVEAIYDKDTYGGKIFYSARSRFNPLGRSVWIEGTTLNIQYSGFLDVGTILTIEYIPSGTARLHNGACTVNAAGDEVTLAASPTTGSLDTHKHAYTGSILRILNVTGTSPTGNYIQERTISAYEHTTRVATLDVALDPVPVAGGGGAILYEIAPAIHKELDQIIAIYTAYTLCGIEGNRNRKEALMSLYRDTIRTLRLSAYYSNIGEAARQRGDNYDNRRYRRV
jgi:hypothetical protein